MEAEETTRSDGRLIVSFCGEVHERDPGAVLTFGRAADLVVDEDNRFMHRAVGRFRHDGGTWWLDNLGHNLELRVDHSAGTRAHLSPRPADGPAPTTALPPDRFRLSFTAGGFNYELAGQVEGEHPTASVPRDAEDLGETQRFGRITLTDEERQLALVLARPLLLDPDARAEHLAVNKVLCQELGWGSVKYNRKLDHLCRRFAQEGVRGLVGTRGEEAGNRRWLLARHLVVSGTIAATELEPQPA